jgi:hypothetical protein
MDRPLKEGDGGPYGDLMVRPLPGGLAVVFMPSLAALLDRAEQIKEAPLAEEQVLRIRDAALVVVTFADVAALTVEQRGYEEVDPADPWRSWQSIRRGTG